MKQLKTLAVALAGGMAVAVLAGCAATTPQIDARQGTAARTMRVQQTLNPEASRNTDPVQGLDGKAAKGALDNYRDSFRTPPSEASQVLSIGVGNNPR